MRRVSEWSQGEGEVNKRKGSGRDEAANAGRGVKSRSTVAVQDKYRKVDSTNAVQVQDSTVGVPGRGCSHPMRSVCWP